MLSACAKTGLKIHMTSRLRVPVTLSRHVLTHRDEFLEKPVKAPLNFVYFRKYLAKLIFVPSLLI